MTRRAAFIGWLFGGAAAGQTVDWSTLDITSITPKLMVQGRELYWFSGPPLNGQCPVCGTMAEKDQRPVIIQKFEASDPYNEWLACRRCNDVFQRTVEEGKP